MIFQGLIDAIPKVFYLLTMSIFSIIDLFQMLMRKLAGLDCYYVEGTAQTGDIVYDFLTGIFSNQYPILSTVFWGLVILGVILLFLSTIIAIIRSEYTTEKADNSKGKIMFKAFKSVIYFALVPVVVLVGVYLANIVLVAVDKATTPNTNNYSSLDTSKLQAVEVASYSFGQESVTKTYVTYSLFGFKNSDGLPYGTTTTTFSGTMFKAAAYNANRVRITANATDDSKNFAKLIMNDQVTSFDGLFKDENFNTNTIANKIDVAFADNVVFSTEMGDERVLDFSSGYIQGTNNQSCDPFPSEEGKVQICADKFNVQLVWYYYDLWQFNFIIAIGAAVICATIFINIIFGLMRRIIEMIGLFLIAAPLIGLMPLDNEKAYNSWRGNFIKKALMAYGAIGGMNIIFVLLPELQTIHFFGDDLSFLNWIVDTLLVLVGLLAVKDFIGVVSNLVGGDDANAVGEKVGKDVGDLAGKAVKIGATAVGGVAGVAKFGAKAIGKVGAGVQYASRRVRGNSTNASATAKERMAHAGEDRMNAKNSVEQKFYEKYKNDNISTYDELYTDKKSKLYNENLAFLKKNDGAAYAQALEEKIKDGFADKRKRNKAYENSIQADINAEFNAKQASRNVTNKQVAANSAIGQAVGRRKEYKESQKELRKLKNAATGKERAVLRSEMRRQWLDATTNNFSGLGVNVVDISKPLIGTTKDIASEVGSIYTSNGFYEGFMGKDKDTLVDAAYRLAGTNKKSVEKMKTKTKEQAGEIKKLKQQQDMLLNALRQIENEKHK